ncbi:MAG TPA: DUF1616 domain-containing protein [Candidatus Sulfotelmatobacter sp.]|nr:DUF1616 domain-containing protein [Candidatus Sulfotelmatobacter sp.]
MYIASLALVIILALVFHSAIDKQMRKWKLLPEPEKLTELYFTHPNNLPSTYTPGEQQTVKFTTHNLEYATTRYNYVITETNVATNQSQALASGSFLLRQNTYQSESVNISTVDLGQQVKIAVNLTNVKESIDYLLARSGA